MEWAAVLFVVAAPLIATAALAAYAAGDQAGRVVTSIPKIERAVIGLATALPPTVLLLYILHLRRVPLERLGLRIDRLPMTVIEGLALYGVAMGLLWLMIDRGPVAPSPLLEISGILGMVLYAFANGFFEELFRAYIIRRTADAWGSLLLGAALSVAIFLGYHIYYRGWHLGWLAAIAVLWAGYYLWRRDVGALAVSHIALDLTTFMINDAG